jgi:hypothetical protein
MPAVHQPDPDLVAHCKALRAKSKELSAEALSLRHRSRFLHSRVRWIGGRVNDLLTISVFQHENVARTFSFVSARKLA